jgi:rSAM/selenodomain-associated transferase 1
MRRALIVVGKAPEAGRTKTRLVPPLTAQQAAELYRAFLLDAIDLGLRVGGQRVSVVHPRGAAPALSRLVPPVVQLLEQPGHGLGDALAFAFERHLGAGFERVVLIGSDNPTLPPEPLEEAFAALETHDLSIGPSADGGYYLIGLRQAHLSLFRGIDWSTPRVHAQTLARARALNLREHTLAEWYDVDTPDDLERLRVELRSTDDRLARHTRAVLTRTTLAGRAASGLDQTSPRMQPRSARLPPGRIRAWPG